MTAYHEVTSEVDYGTTRDGLVQLRRKWSPVGDPSTVVYLLHGIAEHSGRYEHVGGALSGAGFHVVATDHRGYGASGGRRAYVDSWSQYLDDVEDQIAHLRGLGLPVVLLGHSMGGLIATSYCIDDRPLPDYLVVSGPALGYEMSARERFLIALAPVLSRLVPRMEVKEDSDPSMLSTDPLVAEKFYADPLRQGDATINLGIEMFRAMRHTHDNVDQLSIPTLCLHGGDDRLVPTESSEVMAGVEGVERRIYEGLRHEIFNEPSGLEIVDDVIAWINDQLNT